MFTQVITVEKDYGDSTHSSTRIVKSASPIKESDHTLLNYILGCDVTEDHITVEIALLEDVIETFNHDQQTTLLFVEKSDGVFHIHREPMAIAALSIESVNALLVTDLAVTRNPGVSHGEVMYSDVDGRDGNYVVIFDLSKVNRYRMTAKTRYEVGNIERLIEEKGLGAYLCCLPFSYTNAAGQFEQVVLRYFPDSEQFLEATRTTVAFDKAAYKETYRDVARLYDKAGTLLSEHILEG